MTTLIITGNLTKDAEVKTDKNGRNYVLLNIAENYYKRDNKGKVIKDAKGHYETLETFFHSVFVYEDGGALTASKLKKGQAIKVFCSAKLMILKDENDYDQNAIERLKAYHIDTDPFKKSSETDDIASDETSNDIPV